MMMDLSAASLHLSASAVLNCHGAGLGARRQRGGMGKSCTSPVVVVVAKLLVITHDPRCSWKREREK